MHSKAPVSPDDENMLSPCAAICSNRMFSASAYARPASGSQIAQLELTESALSWLAIVAYWSSSVCPVSSLGAL